MADLRPLHEWVGPPAQLTLWQPSERALRGAQCALPSAIPPSFEQEQHLRALRACEQRAEAMARLLIVVWDEPGRCDIRTMSHVINAHLRRHDTYQCWFEEKDGTIQRHVIDDPASIEIEPVALGEVNADEWQRQIAMTPSPFAWACFRFGILQREKGFSFFASIDHLHADSTLIAFLMQDIRTAYHALIDGDQPLRTGEAGSYLHYCRTQRQLAEKTTRDDPDIADWIAFLRRNGGRMPVFPLPLGIDDDRCLAEHVHIQILDADATNRFETRCRDVSVRMIGGVLAGAALAEHILIGTTGYSVVTPITTRRSPADFRTSGWCMGIVPIDFPLNTRDFGALATLAQQAFDDRSRLAHRPIEHVLELCADLPDIRPVATGGVMLSYMDIHLPPLSAHMAKDWHRANGRVYINQGIAAQVALWFFQTQDGLALTASYPTNDTARASMRRYIEHLTKIFQQLAIAGSVA